MQKINRVAKEIFYKLSLTGLHSDPFIYKSDKEIEEGSFVKVHLFNKIKDAIVLNRVEKPEFKCKEIIEITDLFLPRSYLKIARFISEYYFCSYGEAVALFTPFKINSNYTENNHDILNLPTLTKKQKEAFEFAQNKDISLLFGDTASGKTEIYIKMIADVLKERGSALFLMPEISLTPQMEKRLKRVFGRQVAIWHSKVSKKKKSEILNGIHSGDIRLVAGARSSLFLPLKDLKLIVVDEEHDQSYKASNRPRYSARDMALYFSKILGARVVLGSATPSLTSYYNYPFFRLKGSFKFSSKKYIFEKNSEELSSGVIKYIDKTLKENKQTIIFLPTRANFKYIICFDCGNFVKCPFCSVGMSLHKKRNALVCHYCGYACRVPKECPSCKSEHLNSFRMGTQEVKDKLEEIFKDAKIAKFDRDAIKSERELKRVLKDFNDNKIDILVGTQMLSKGHDYKDVKLSIVLGIDILLCQNDFKARENALSLTLQIAGRSGRDEEGTAIIQTSNEEFFKRYIDDYEKFLKDELKSRVDLYPPYKKLARVLFADKKKEKAEKQMRDTLECLGKNMSEDVEIVGYGEAFIEKIASKYRYNILLRSTSSASLVKLLHKCKKSFCEIDMDPLSFS